MPAAHGVAVDPSDRYVLVADFGADRVFIHHFDAANKALTPAEPPFEALPAGSGPRHLLFDPSGRWLFLDAELTGEVRAYRWDARRGSLQLVQSISPYPADYAGDKSAAELAISHDGRFVYLSLRGDQNAMVVYAVDPRAGMLKEVQRMSSQGRGPWSFVIDRTGRWMAVTNQASDSVALFGIDSATGQLAATGESLPVPKPVTATFYSH
jgi:6-phosphogluconolactonase